MPQLMIELLSKRFPLKLMQGFGDETGSEDTGAEQDPDNLEDFFANLADNPADFSIDDSEEEEEEESEKPVAVEEAKPDAPKEEQKPTVEEPPKEEAPAPVVEEQPKVEPPKEEAPAKTEEEQVAEFNQVMGELQKVYAISEEDADAILTDPKNAVPKLMANAHVRMMQTVHNMMQQLVPAMVEQHQIQSKSRQTLTEKFSQAWPELASEQNKNVVIAAIQTVRTVNPGIDVDTLIEKVGPVAYSILGKPVPAKEEAKPAPARQVAKPKPHQPARARETSTAKPGPTGDHVADFINTLLSSKD